MFELLLYMSSVQSTVELKNTVAVFIFSTDERIYKYITHGKHFLNNHILICLGFEAGFLTSAALLLPFSLLIPHT